MRTEAAERAVYEAMIGAGFSRDRSQPGMPRFRGDILAAGRRVEVVVEFPCLDFAVLPRAVLVDRERDVPGGIAHIDRDGAVCYAAPGAVVLDRYRPGEHVLTVLGMVRRTLEEILDGGAEGAVIGEFPQHWHGGQVHVALPPDAPEGEAELYLVPRRGDDVLLLLTRDGRGLSVFSREDRTEANASRLRAWITRAATPLSFRGGRTQPGTFEDFLGWAATCEPGLDKRLLTAAKIFFKRRPWLFVMAPNGCVGVELKLPLLVSKSIQTAPFHRRILDNMGAKITVERWSGTPMHTDIYFARNLGGRPGLAGRSVVLVGCGTIGSHLAKFLAQTGAGYRGRFVLVDPDIMSPGNVGRHWLGPGHVGVRKAEACRDVLKAMFPDSDIRSICKSILSRPGLLAGAELVVDATGEEAVSVGINEFLVRRRPEGPTAVHVWLTGNGAAAQSLKVRHDLLGGCCFKCLRVGSVASRRYWPMADGFEVEQVPAACGEAAFVPYGVAAPAIAAGLATKAGLDWARGSNEPSLRTVRVDLGSTVEVSDCTPEPRRDCPACGRPEHLSCSPGS